MPEHIDVSHTIEVASGVDALVLPLTAPHFNPGDRMIASMFVAPAGAIHDVTGASYSQTSEEGLVLPTTDAPAVT